MKIKTNFPGVLSILGSLLVVLGMTLLIPLVFVVALNEYQVALRFIVPAVLSALTGLLLKAIFKPGKIYFLQSLLVCGTAWIVLSVFACLPFCAPQGLGFLDAYFETVSGFTTTGITVYTNIEAQPLSLLFWRSLIQWLGGLGILTLFLAVTFKSNNAYFQLFAAESHKIDSSRPTPSIFKTVLILWGIYGALTFSELIILKLLGLSFFDALCHSLTTLSTGGFSTYDASIAYFKDSGYANYQAIEYVITFFMFTGGVNFLMHYLVITGRLRDVLGNTEFRYYLLLIVLCVTFILVSNYYQGGFEVSLEEEFRTTLFTTVSLLTTTGYGTADINNPFFFPALAQQFLLVLMLIGGCVGSTAGGIKVLRVKVLMELFKNQVRRLRFPRQALAAVVIDRNIFPDFEIKRITGLFFGWLFLILIGGGITAIFARNLSAWESMSGMFSALGNIGPVFFGPNSVQKMSALPPIVKLTYIFGMLAGRLEILPILLLFSRRAWIN